MIGIRSIASYIPPDAISNYDRREEFALTDAFIVEKLGVERVSRKGVGEETSTMCVSAFSTLQSKLPVDPSEIELIVVCTQNPDGHGIPHTSAVVHGAIGAPERCAAFDISLGCSGFVYGLSVATSFMAANGLKRGLLFTADPYSKILNPSDRNTVLLFGDAATVTLLQAADGRNPFWMPERFRFATRGKEGGALNNDSGNLEMNGRAVFNFSATEVPVQIRALLADCGLTLDAIDLYLLHQGSRFIVDTIARRMQLDRAKVPSNLARQGNTVSSSIPLLFEGFLENESVRRVVISGFGVGLSWASCVLERRQ
ncbi:MAG TPA: ketoacyl-ACP synthase III [Burkholderiales bacterium]|nr:ketoacyl-ACP synthase III [Burkholderiales bacterium]